MNTISLFLGAGGTGMQGLAYLFREKGRNVIAYDDNPDIPGVSLSEAQDSLSNISLLVYTDAAPETHPLRQAASVRGIKQIPYHEALGEFSQAYTTIAITGTHGKSSTTAFLAHMCIEAGLDPTILLGARLRQGSGGQASMPGGHARLGKGKYFIVEADEYRRHFLPLAPAHAIITTIDFDHPDAFLSITDVEYAYAEFIARVQKDGIIAIPKEEHDNHPNITWPDNTVLVPESNEPSFKPPLPGKHMSMNAMLAATIAERLGIPVQKALASLASFPGLERRFELLGNVRGCDIRSDYGHHPAEIRATISSAREAYPSGTLTVLLEAHMPLRLRTFFDDFASALSLADTILITAPFAPAGRDEKGIDDAKLLVDTLVKNGKKALYCEDPTKYIAETLNGDVLLFFSAGTLDSKIRKTVKLS